MLFFLAGCSSDGRPSPFEELLDWNHLPVLHPYTYRQFSSYDRLKQPRYPLVDPGNKDFNNFLSVCGDRQPLFNMETDTDSFCDKGMEGYLIAHVEGTSGFVSRIWTTAAPAYTREDIKIYVDDLTEPVYTDRVKDWGSPRETIFVEPIAGPRSGSFTSYLPIAFKKSLRILLDNLSPAAVYYHHVNVQLGGSPGPSAFEETPQAPGGLLEATVNVPAFHNTIGTGQRIIDQSFDVSAVTPGEILIPGQGTIRRITFLFPSSAEDLIAPLELEVRWDEAEEATFRVPLAAFFGSEIDMAPFESLPLSVSQSENSTLLSSYFPMPFRRSASIRLISNSEQKTEINATVTHDSQLPEGEWGYFMASYGRKEAPIPSGSRFPVATISGRGKYVGTFMFLEGGVDPEFIVADPFNFLEGDEFGVVDGELSIPGTGTEDYFNGGFYFLEGPYDSPFGGINYKGTGPDGSTGKVSVYRWHVLADEINFRESFSLEFEYGADRPSVANRYASVAYYYLRIP